MKSISLDLSTKLGINCLYGQRHDFPQAFERGGLPLEGPRGLFRKPGLHSLWALPY